LCLFPTPPTPHIYTRSLHDALPICFPSTSTSARPSSKPPSMPTKVLRFSSSGMGPNAFTRTFSPAYDLEVSSPGLDRPLRTAGRSEEHTSELQSRGHLVCRLLLEKK